MKLHRIAAVFLPLLLLASPVWAHFLWVAVESEGNAKPAAFVWFSELAEADSADLIDRVVKTKVWTRAANAKSQPVTVAKQVKDGGGALVGPVTEGTSNLSAHIEYGVLDRGDSKFLLQYWAKYIDLASSDWKAIARDEALKLDVVPHATDSGVTLEVLYQGKPAEGSEVVILDPTAAETKVKADASGKLQLDNLKPGLYSIRAKWVVMEKGTLGDKDYPQINHYSTLALRVPAKK